MTDTLSFQKQLLATVLHHEAVLDDLDIQPNEFSSSLARQVFEAASALRREDKPVDVMTVASTVNMAEADLLKHFPQDLAVSVEEVLKIEEQIRREEFLRNIRGVGIILRNVESVWSNKTIEEIAAEYEKLVSHARVPTRTGQLLSFGDQLAEWKEELKKRMELGGELAGVDTGLLGFNAITNGLQPGTMVVIAARPSIGKTSFALHLCVEAAQQPNTVVAFMSLEMKKTLIYDRIHAMGCPIAMHDLQDGTLSPNHHKLIDDFDGQMMDKPLYIDDSQGVSVQDIRRKVLRLRRRNPDARIVVCVDYLQLINEKANNRTEEVSAISRGLKGIAQECNCVMIAVAQLNRNVDNRMDKRPMLSDLKESGQIEQDADLVVMLYREDYYTGESGHKVLEINVAKNRNGATGTAYVRYLRETQQFIDVEDDELRSYLGQQG